MNRTSNHGATFSFMCSSGILLLSRTSDFRIS
uniref:Uncharacterized protein n=1 Tax=Siphoviridae sp. ctXQ014 TaxID=2825542 RepID=A0A8S5PNU1_9CAUD|nr:MAG TPA: hypothetical protein [Siphoviridae sp. ctXQ014]